jgi:enoyl-CoA hydratase/carnithine racemase
MEFKFIKYRVVDNILTLTLNRPDQLNAFTRTMTDEVIDALDRADADDGVRAIVVTGAGRAFSAGADLSVLGAPLAEQLKAVGDDASLTLADGACNYSAEAARDYGGVLTLRLFKCLKPIIAAVNGAAVGMGVTMQLAMDIRLASRDARFGFVFARRGIVPEAASSWFLSRTVGLSRALEWCYSGRVFPAQEAHEAGLVRSLHAPEDLLPAAYEIAREIADNTAPVSVALTRQMLWRMAGAEHPMAAHRIDSRAIVSRRHSADAREGIASFLEKRPARYPNRVSSDMPDFFPWWEEPEYR